MLACAARGGRVWRVGLPQVTAFLCTLSNAQPSWGPGSCQELQRSPSCTAWPCSSVCMSAQGWGLWGLSPALGREGLGMASGQPSCVGLGCAPQGGQTGPGDAGLGGQWLQGDPGADAGRGGWG